MPDTQAGFACLEALVDRVSICGLGTRFDGSSAHDLPVKPTVTHSQERTYMQLRPGESFYVRDLCLTLVPEEVNNAYVEATATLPPASRYERYSQVVSQIIGESQQVLATSPDKMREINLETPKKGQIPPGSSPLASKVVAASNDDIVARRGQYVTSPLAPSITEQSSSHIVRTSSPRLLECERIVFPHVGNGQPVNHSPQAVEPQYRRCYPERPENGLENTLQPPAMDWNEDARIFHIGVPNMQDETAARPSPFEQTVETAEEPDSLNLPARQVAPIIDQATIMPSPDHPKRELSADDQKQHLGNEERHPSSSQTTDQTSDGEADGPMTVRTAALNSTRELSDAEDNQPPQKRQKTSGSPKPIPTEESQDSLAGKIIEVYKPPEPAKGTKRRILGLSRPNSSSQTPLARTTTPRSQTLSTAKSVDDSPAISAEPPSSTRSTRSSKAGDLGRPSIDRDGIHVVFASSTSVGDSRAFKKFLSERGVHIIQKVAEATCLCVGNGELKKTSKLMLAVVLGLHIVREDWVIESARLKALQPLDSYLARDPPREKEWGIDLADAIERGRGGLRIFDGHCIVITPAVKKEIGKDGSNDLKEVALCAGAKSVTNTLPKKGDKGSPSTVVIGMPVDKASAVWKDRRVFTKDIIGLSVLRGKLDVEDDEFLISAPVARLGSSKKRKK